MSFQQSSHLELLHLTSKKSMNAENHRLSAEELESATIPHADLFESLYSSPGITRNDAWPTLGECAVHLELLEAFFALREKILVSEELDHTFGIKRTNRTVYRASGPHQLWDNTWEVKRRLKWFYFLLIAVERFKEWVAVADEAARGTLDAEGKMLPHLPPLDVLMVWHAFLLNPKDFDAFCTGRGLLHIRRVSFPWPQIYNAIDGMDWGYKLPRESERWIVASARMEPDLLQHLIRVGSEKSSASALLATFGDPLPETTHGRKLARNATTLERVFFRALDTIIDALAQGGSNPLAENVQRQATFVDKMHRHLWIRSPAAAGTLRRALGRYGRLVTLFSLYPGRVLVPSLDTDLAWHTHQCSAARYEEAMRSRTGRFIDHDDKIGRATLDGAEGGTAQLFRIHFAEDYAVCLCWDCEAVASVVEDADRDGTLEDADFDALAEKVRVDVAYHRAVELTRRDRYSRSAKRT